MKFDAHFGDAEAIQLKAAILLYGGAKRISFASVHEPYRDPAGGAPYLDAGRPISTEFLRALAHGLGLRMAPEILPESVVIRTPEVTAWWEPASVRPMFFSETSDGKTLNGKAYPHPPLVFLGDTKQLNEQLEAINCVELGYSSRLDESCGDGCGVPPSARPRWKCRFHIRWCPALL